MRVDRNRRTSVLWVAAFVLGAVPAFAQVAERFLQTQRENALALRKYTWKSRVEVRQGGETRSVQLFHIRYDIDGSLQKTALGGTPPPELPRRPLLRKVAEKKTREYQELVGALSELARSYANLPPERMQALLGGANVIAPLDRPAESVQVQANNVLQQGDSMTTWIDSSTHQQQRVEVRTFLDGKAVRVVSEFRRLAGGPTYAARVVVEYPSESLRLVTENFDDEA